MCTSDSSSTHYMSPKPTPYNFAPEYKREKWAAVAASCKRNITDGQLVSSSPYAYTHASNPINRSRNRYTNVLPYDRTRVQLKTLAGGSDYINALILRLAQNKYIAAQGPLPSTIHHFWAMCFDQAIQQNVDVILVVMVTPLQERGVVKCAKYWPSKGDGVIQLGSSLAAEDLAYGDLELEWISSEEKDLFTISNFRLSAGSVTKNVLHYYYGKWEDSMPPTRTGPLAALASELDLARKAFPGIIPIIHCSAGVGRTGTLIAYDHFCHGDAIYSSDDPVYETISKLREQRMMMVQTWQQFKFLYDVVDNMVGEEAAHQD